MAAVASSSASGAVAATAAGPMSRVAVAAGGTVGSSVAGSFAFAAGRASCYLGSTFTLSGSPEKNYYKIGSL